VSLDNADALIDGVTNPLPARVTTKVEVMLHPLKSTLGMCPRIPFYSAEFA